MIKGNYKKIIFSIFLILLSAYILQFVNWPEQKIMVEEYHMMGTGMGWMMFLFWGLVLGILIQVIRWVSNLPQRDNRFSKIQTNASQILKERFARGEIDIAEFELKKQIISD
jgi:uncharacterized membrane protein